MNMTTNEEYSSMYKKFAVGVMAVAALALTTGCSTLVDAKAAKGTGQSREYSKPIDTVWKAIPPALSELKLPLVAENRQEGLILAQNGISALSYGENVAIFVESINGGEKTRVEVVSKKALATNVFATNWADVILEKLSAMLK